MSMPDALRIDGDRRVDGIELAFAIYGSDKGSPRIGLYGNHYEAFRPLTRDEMREIRDWLDGAIRYVEEREKARAI